MVYKSERLELRLTPREVEILDDVRGPASRSAWIRAQIANAGKPAVKTEGPRAHPGTTEVLLPGDTHVHTWKRAGDLFDRCPDCGDTRRRA